MAELQVETGKAYSWSVPGIPGIECFRAEAILHSYGRHSHPTYALGVIEEGIGGNEYRGAIHRIPSGSLVVMNPDEVHTGYAADHQALSYRMFYIETEVFSQLFPVQAKVPFFSGACIHDSAQATRLRQLHSLLETSAETLEQQTLAAQILADFTQIYGAPGVPEPARPEPQLVACVKEFLHAQFERNVSIEELAQLTQRNQSYLIRAFQREVGLPPHVYLVQLRIEQAKKLLAQGRQAAQVALEVGFADQSHFTRHFKRVVGLTPSQYARGHFHSRQATPLT